MGVGSAKPGAKLVPPERSPAKFVVLTPVSKLNPVELSPPSPVSPGCANCVDEPVSREPLFCPFPKNEPLGLLRSGLICCSQLGTPVVAPPWLNWSNSWFMRSCVEAKLFPKGAPAPLAMPAGENGSPTLPGNPVDGSIGVLMVGDHGLPELRLSNP